MPRNISVAMTTEQVKARTKCVTVGWEFLTPGTLLQPIVDYFDAEIGRAHVELSALRAEHKHAQIVIKHQARRIRELEARTKGQK